MRLIKLRAISIATSLAVLAGAAGLGQFVHAAPGGPTVVLSSTTSGSTNSTSIPVTATFSEAVNGFSSAGIAATNATVSGFAGSGSTYTFNLVPTANGPVTASVSVDAATSTSSSTGNQVSNTLTFTFDNIAPTISRTIDATATTATISWTTNENAVGQVNYGLDVPYTASTTMETTPGLTHTVTITGLTASTTYHYEITSRDAAGNTGTTGDLVFTTPAASTPGLPVISNITVNPTDTGAVITWDTDAAASSQIFYGTTTPYSSSTTLNSTPVTSHSVTLTGLTASTTYHYQVQSANSAGTATFADRTFTTTSSSSVGAPVITNITVNPTNTGAVITWNTDVAASSQILYGLTDTYSASTTFDSTPVTSHSVTLTGLTASTTYHYSVHSGNSAGMTSFADRTFSTTNASSSPVVLSLTGIDSVNTLALPDNTYGNGFKWILHLTVPDSETSFALRFNDFTSPTASTTIPVAGNLRYFSSQSSNATGESTAVTETNNDYGTALNLTGDTSSTTPGRQIDVTVELKVPVGTHVGTYSALFGARSL